MPFSYSVRLSRASSPLLVQFLKRHQRWGREDLSDQQRGDQQPGRNRPKLATENRVSSPSLALRAQWAAFRAQSLAFRAQSVAVVPVMDPDAGGMPPLDPRLFREDKASETPESVTTSAKRRSPHSEPEAQARAGKAHAYGSPMNLVRWVPRLFTRGREDSNDQRRGDQQPGRNRPKLATENRVSSPSLALRAQWAAFRAQSLAFRAQSVAVVPVMDPDAGGMPPLDPRLFREDKASETPESVTTSAKRRSPHSEPEAQARAGKAHAYGSPMNLVRWVPRLFTRGREDSNDQRRGDQQPGRNRPKFAMENRMSSGPQWAMARDSGLQREGATVDANARRLAGGGVGLDKPEDRIVRSPVQGDGIIPPIDLLDAEDVALGRD